MVSPRSLASTTRFARAIAALSLVTAAALAMRGDDVRACSGGDPTIEAETTFDPAVIGKTVAPGLFFDSHVAGYGDRCTECEQKAVAADWHAYLGGTVTDADWHYVLYEATDSDLGAVAQRLAGKPMMAPKGLERSSLWAKPAPAAKLRAAVTFAQLARRVEAVDTFDAGYDDQGNQKKAPAPTPELLADARAGYASAHGDPFLAQRYGLQVLRVLFYRKDFAGVEKAYEASAQALLGPSADIAFRARYYEAGALMRNGKRPRANLELARIVADDPARAGVAMRDFQPLEDTDWKLALGLAQTPRDKAALWQLVGIKVDPLAAVREILKLDPKSNLIPLLIVRELARDESIGVSEWGPPEPAALAAQSRGYATLEQLVTSLAASPATDKPWVMELVLGHIAARRGDVATTRAHSQQAMALRPADVTVSSQAKASLAIALVASWAINPQREDELAQLMAGMAANKEFGRATTVREQVRGKLALAYKAAGKLVDAELLVPGTIVPLEELTTRPATGSYDKTSWADRKFIAAMIARLQQKTTAFDRFVLETPITEPQLERDLALRYLVDGDYTQAWLTFANTKASSTQLHTDPFVIHIRDCHDCDHDKFANAPWTHASFAQKLGELAKTAAGTGEPAAEAALQLGNALYNITWFGNARAVLEDSHAQTDDTGPALRWYKRAFELTKNRELKAKAAYLAAKCERGSVEAEARNAPPPADGAPDVAAPDATPKTWFAALYPYRSTRYYAEVIKECGYFSTWVSQTHH